MEHKELVERLQQKGVQDTDALDFLGKLHPDVIVDILAKVRQPGIAIYAVQHFACDLRGRIVTYIEDTSKYDQGDKTALLFGLIAHHLKHGTTLEERFDPFLATKITIPWTDDLRQLLITALASLPKERCEKLLLGNGVIAWYYLEACPSPHVIHTAVKTVTQGTVFPLHTDMAFGLIHLGNNAAEEIARAIVDSATTREGKRILVAALSRLHNEKNVLFDVLQDRDTMVQRFARDGLDHRGIPVPFSFAIPEELTQVRTQRLSVAQNGSYKSLRTRINKVLQTISRDQKALEKTWKDEISREETFDALLILGDLWLESIRFPQGDYKSYLIRNVMVHCLVHFPNHPLTPWFWAELLCRIPPDAYNPIEIHRPMDTIPSDFAQEVVTRLSEILNPVDCCNPLWLYDWLATKYRELLVQSPAFFRGLQASDECIRDLCNQIQVAEKPGRISLTSVQDFADALQPVIDRSHYGEFGVFAIDTMMQRTVGNTWLDPDEAPEPQEIEHAFTAKYLVFKDKDLAIGKKLELFLTILRDIIPDSEIVNSWNREYEEELDLKQAQEELVKVMVGDNPYLTHTDAEARVKPFIQLFSSETTCLQTPSIANVAFSTAMYCRSADNRYHVLVIYLNDQ